MCCAMAVSPSCCRARCWVDQVLIFGCTNTTASVVAAAVSASRGRRSGLRLGSATTVVSRVSASHAEPAATALVIATREGGSPAIRRLVSSSASCVGAPGHLQDQTTIRRPRGSGRGPARTSALCRRSASKRGWRHAASACGQGGRSTAACCRRDRTTLAAANSRRRRHRGRSGPVGGRTCEILPIQRFQARHLRRLGRASPPRRRRCSCRRGTVKRGADGSLPSITAALQGKDVRR